MDIKLEEIDPETCNWEALAKEMIPERKEEFLNFWIAYITKSNARAKEGIISHCRKIRGMEIAEQLKEEAERARKGAEELRKSKANVKL